MIRQCKSWLKWLTPAAISKLYCGAYSRAVEPGGVYLTPETNSPRSARLPRLGRGRLVVSEGHYQRTHNPRKLRWPRQATRRVNKLARSMGLNRRERIVIRWKNPDPARDVWPHLDWTGMHYRLHGKHQLIIDTHNVNIWETLAHEVCHCIQSQTREGRATMHAERHKRHRARRYEQEADDFAAWHWRLFREAVRG